MWHLNLEKIAAAAGAPSLGNIAIETGTCRGNGTRALARAFSRVITMELSESLHRESKARLEAEGLRNVSFLLGNSAELLPKVLDELPESDAVFFFLDAHWSGDDSVPWQEARWKGYGFNTAHLGTAGHAPSGPEQCPLAEEFSAIVRHCRGPTILLVDDAKNLPANGPGAKDLEFPGEDWSHLSRRALRNILGERLLREQDLRDPNQWLLQLHPRAGARGLADPSR